MNIIDYLNAQKIDTLTINQRKKEGINFLEAFLGEAQSDLMTLLYHKLSELSVAYFVSIAPEKIDDINAMMQKYESLFRKDNFEVLRIMIYIATDEDFLKAYYTHGLNLSELNNATAKMAFKYQFQGFASIKLLIRFFFKINDFKDFLNFFNSISFNSQNANELCTILITAMDIQKAYATFGENDLTSKSIKKTEKKLGKIAESYSYIEGNYFERKREYAKEVREANKYNNSLQKCIDLLKRNPRYIAPSIMSKILSLNIDNKIKHEILNYIYSINSREEASIKKAYEEAKTSSKEGLIELLTSYNIDFNELSKKELESLKNISSLNLKKMLEFFFYYQIPLDNIARLAYFDIQTIEEVANLLQNGVLTAKFVENNLNILEKDSPTYKLIIVNLGLLSSMEINIKNYPDSLDILLIDLSYPLFLISKYKINITNKTKDISFLANENLEAKLDLIIESGTDLNTLPNYDILNFSFKQLYLKMFSSMLGIEYSKEAFAYFTTEELMPDCSLLIPDSFINALQNASVSASLPDFLAKYVINSNALVINGVFVSLNRVLKNLGCIDIDDNEQIFYAIIYKAHYNLREVCLIKEEIMGLERSI